MNANEQAKVFLDSLLKKKELWIWLLKYGALFLVFLFFFLPVQSRLSSNSAQLSSLKKQIEGLKQITTTLLTPEEIDRVKGRVDKFESNLADLTKTNAILDEISKVAEENHLKMVQIYSDSPALVKNETGQDLMVGGKKLSMLPVNFRVEADYKNLSNFLKALNDSSQWTYTVESMQIQNSSSEGENLQCDVILSYIIR